MILQSVKNLRYGLVLSCSLVTFTGSKFHENNKSNFSQFDASLLQESLHLNDLQFLEETLPLTHPSLNVKAKT